MFQGKKILVAGGSGFVGANLVKRLLETGATIRATYHNNPPVIKDDRIDYQRCDLRNPEDCMRACQDIDYVFLCAAVTAGAAMIQDRPLFLLTPNVAINLNMLEAAYACNVTKTLFISSNTVYPEVDFPVTEDDVTNEYFEKYFVAGWMKRFCESVCEMYAQRIPKPMATVVVRPANIYGPLDNFDWKTSHVLPALIRRVVERHQPMEIWGDGMDIKDFIYVEDFVEGMLAAMAHDAPYEIYNIASGNGYRLSEILASIIEVDGYHDAQVEYDPSKPTMIPIRLMNPGKAKRELNFEAVTPIEEGLRRTISWYRESQNEVE